jgi:hypothetical protein
LPTRTTKDEALYISFLFRYPETPALQIEIHTLSAP